MDRIKRFQKTPEFTAIVSALVMGYLTHNFALTNVMHNIDDIGNQPYGYGMGLDMGRWLLTVLGDFAEVLGAGRNLHYINGILFIVLIAISAAFVVSSLKIHSCISASLIGMLFAVFPSGVIALTYRFTSVYYGLSLLMAVGAAWVIHRYRNGFLLSAVLIAASLGIYQAYVSFPISIWVLLLIRQALTKEKEDLAVSKAGADVLPYTWAWAAHLFHLSETLLENIRDVVKLLTGRGKYGQFCTYGYS